MHTTRKNDQSDWATRWKENLPRFGYLIGAIFFHLIIFVMLATWVIWKAPRPPRDDAFQPVKISTPPPPPPAPPPPSGSAASNPQLEPTSVTVPVVTPMAAITTTHSNFAIDASNALSQAMSHQSLPDAQGSGLGKGAADAGLGSGKSEFFGVPVGGTNKHIGFLLDYSGSMDGAFRTIMEKQLEAALKHLGKDSQVTVICWAGPAWLYSETAPQIAKKWKMLGSYDNFAPVNGAQFDPPQWLTVTDENIKKIMDGLKAQVAAPGGTAWPPAFHYVMKADPQPDTIFFLTDGQIPANRVDIAQHAVDIEMKKADVAPQINCLWIENTGSPSGPMEALAKKYNGEFRKVSAKTVAAGP